MHLIDLRDHVHVDGDEALVPKRYPLPRGFDPGGALERWSELPGEELDVRQTLLVARRGPT